MTRPLAPAPGRHRRARVNDVEGWTSYGRALRSLARRTRRCVECGMRLAGVRSEYCSRRCLHMFHARFFWDAARIVALRRDRGRCQACGATVPRRRAEVDHIQELAAGGAALDLENLQTLCRRCHRAKTVDFLRRRGRALSVPAPGTGRAPGTFEPADWFPA